jgi:hypothetical protein
MSSYDKRRGGRSSLLLLFVLALGLCACGRRGDGPVGAGSQSHLYRIIRTVATTGYAKDVYLEGGLAYVAASEAGLRVIDISSPAAAHEIAGIDLALVARSVFVSQGNAFVARGAGGIDWIDVTDPDSLARLTTLFGTYSSDIDGWQPADSLLYLAVAERDGGLYLWDVSTRGFPDLMLQYRDLPGYVRGVCVVGERFYVADGQWGLAVLEMSTPWQLEFLGLCDTPGNARSVDVEGEYAYVADGRSGLQIIDISNPGAMDTVSTIVGSLNTSDYAWSVVVESDTAYVADGYGGLKIIDVGEPAHPRLIDVIDTPHAEGVAVGDGDIYVADRDWGLVIVGR